MSHTVTVEEAASRLADLVAHLNPGDEITLLAHNRPVAKIVPQPRRRAGFAKGMITENPKMPDDVHLKDFQDYMR